MSRDAAGRQRVLAARFGALAAVILASIASIMLAPAASGDRVAGHLLQALPVFVGMYLAGRSTQLAAAAALVLVASAALSSLALLRDEARLLAADAVVHALVLGAIAAWVVREVLRDERVSLNTILGAICAYLLLGFLYANVFRGIHCLDPGAFAAASGPLDPHADRSAILYFSYATLTTVAYGDITPASAAARFVALTEGMVGQLYPAIFLARLVSLNVAQRGRAATRE